MKKSFKTLAALAMLLVLLAGLVPAALAADASISFDGKTVGFTFQPGSAYTATDLFDNFKGVMPGDVRTQTITFTNHSKDGSFVNLYMRAVPHGETENPLSEKVAAAPETVATMTEFLKQLTMTVTTDGKTIYEATPDQTAGLTDRVFLGKFYKDETKTLTVTLTVPLTLGNEFMDRVGEVDWEFTVEAFDESQLTVRKVWSDGNRWHENDSVKVNLLKDGAVDQTVELNAQNQWAYTFDHLVEGHTWTAEEAEVPSGYRVSYQTEGTTVTITNTRRHTDRPDPPKKDEKEPLDFTVIKQWSGDEKKNRPDSVTVTLYDGEKAVDTVTLGDWNDWTYTWDDLSPSGNWQGLETSIPKGYTPSYKMVDGALIITNNGSLIVTGQNNTPMLILAALGALLILCGAYVLLKKKRA